jgi:hypothetical protein
MKRVDRTVMMLVVACACMSGAAQVSAQANGAPPGNVSPGDSGAGKSAGIAGGAGAAGQAGTDPATLRRAEEARVQKKHPQGASGSGAAQRKDWKE